MQTKLAILIALLSGSAMPAMAQDQAAEPLDSQQAERSDPPVGLEEIVVTATRREQRLQDSRSPSPQ